MKTSTKIMLGVGGLIFAVGIGYAIKRSMNKKSLDSGMASETDFDAFVSASNKAGYDTFAGLDEKRIAWLKKGFTKNVSKIEFQKANAVVAAAKREKDWTAEEKGAVVVVIQKMKENSKPSNSN